MMVAEAGEDGDDARGWAGRIFGEDVAEEDGLELERVLSLVVELIRVGIELARVRDGVDGLLVGLEAAENPARAGRSTVRSEEPTSAPGDRVEWTATPGISDSRSRRRSSGAIATGSPEFRPLSTPVAMASDTPDWLRSSIAP